MGSDVEGRIGHSYAFGSNGYSLDMSHLLRTSLFNWDLVATGQGEVNGGGRGGNIEGDLVLLGENRNRVGADLVRHFSGSSESAITPDNYQIDLTPGEKQSGGVVGDDGVARRRHGRGSEQGGGGGSVQGERL